MTKWNASITNLKVKKDLKVERTADLDAVKVKYVGKTSAYTATGDDCIIGVNTTSAAVTITLGSDLVSEGRIVIIKDIGGAAATNAITVATEGSETIDGSASTTITTNYGVLRLFSDGTNWFSF